MTYHPDTVYRIALKMIPNVGSVTIRNLVSYCGSVRGVFDATRSSLLRIPGVGPILANRIVSSDTMEAAERELEYLVAHRIRVLFYLDQDYPSRLKHIEQAPSLLYVKGNLDLNAARVVGVVGTRKPTEYGKAVVASVISDLQGFKPLIVSGLAYGIDIQAHRNALKYGLQTAAVMGSGMDHVYPQHHHNVARQMLEQGGLVTEFDHSMGPERDNFPARNRIIAGLADIVVVVESGTSGGSIITAEFANSFNRDVAAIPGRVFDETSQGCNSLIKRHKAHLVNSGHEIAELMTWNVDSNARNETQASFFADLSDSERLVLEVLGRDNQVEIDWIRFKTKMRLSELATVLLSLEFKGIVQALPGQRFQRTN